MQSNGTTNTEQLLKHYTMTKFQIGDKVVYNGKNNALASVLNGKPMQINKVILHGEPIGNGEINESGEPIYRLPLFGWYLLRESELKKV